MEQKPYADCVLLQPASREGESVFLNEHYLLTEGAEKFSFIMICVKDCNRELSP